REDALRVLRTRDLGEVVAANVLAVLRQDVLEVELARRPAGEDVRVPLLRLLGVRVTELADRAELAGVVERLERFADRRLRLVALHEAEDRALLVVAGAHEAHLEELLALGARIGRLVREL